MTTKTIYTCDRCGNEQLTNEQFWTVGITARCEGATTYSYPVKSMQVCRPCLESLGIHVTKKNDGSPPAPIPTTEDLIREIIQRCQE